VIAALLLAASVLPASPQPSPPFPRIITDAPEFTQSALGVTYGRYDLLTQDGPLSVHVLAVDLRNPHVRMGAVLAHDHLLSSGETVSSMAHRTGAVAGVNGDYFDINQTNQPLNILIQNGNLVRMPMQRWALAFDRAGRPQVAAFHVTAQAQLPAGFAALKTLNDWPPPGDGSVLITPEYGPLHPAANVTEYTLQPLTDATPFAQYRITGIEDSNLAQPPGYYFAVGTRDYGTFPLPNAGDTISVTATSEPPIDAIATAIGGGPLLVKDGRWYADPDGPNTGEFLTHMPATAAGITGDGTLLLFEIDGRQPELSVGVLQPQLAALMISFGVVTGMQFDGGGSSTMVARLPGDTQAAVRNSPSDGTERRVGDALLVYSDAPIGPPAKIASIPQIVRALPRARVPVRVVTTDESDRTVACGCNVRLRVVPGDAGRIDGETFVAGARPENAVITVEAGALRTRIPVRVTTAVARTQILPLHPAVAEGGVLQLQARAYDAQGYAIAVPERLVWHAHDARIDDTGLLRANQRDAQVDVTLGAAVAQTTVTVGEHAEDVALERADFFTAPRGGPGGISVGTICPGCLTLSYDFTGSERAAYAGMTLQLPQRALGLQADVFGDGNGEVLRVAIDNAIHERFLYTLAKIDWRGWRHVAFRFSSSIAQPITFKSLYAIDRVGPEPPAAAAGSVTIRRLQVVLAGSDPTRTK